MPKLITTLFDRIRTKESDEMAEARIRAQQNLEFRASQLMARQNARQAAA